jgi:hypothetical protein
MSEPEAFAVNDSDLGAEDALAEEIDASEVDRVLDVLCALMESSPSPTIRDILEGACCDLAELRPSAEDEEEIVGEAA